MMSREMHIADTCVRLFSRIPSDWSTSMSYSEQRALVIGMVLGAFDRPNERSDAMILLRNAIEATIGFTSDQSPEPSTN